ncbi:MAG: hypothetical protein MJZ33_07600 [Paludibacteraceae bacterium]|nr:hypothetical protein [Paludibacteraceae bacterium]
MATPRVLVDVFLLAGSQCFPLDLKVVASSHLLPSVLLPSTPYSVTTMTGFQPDCQS